jgi:hypothetical protein
MRLSSPAAGEQSSPSAFDASRSAGTETFPGSAASCVLVVSTATVTVRRSEGLQESALMIATGRRSAGAEPRGRPRSAHQTSPCVTRADRWTPTPRRRLAARRPTVSPPSSTRRKVSSGSEMAVFTTSGMTGSYLWTRSSATAPLHALRPRGAEAAPAAPAPGCPAYTARSELPTRPRRIRLRACARERRARGRARRSTCHARVAAGQRDARVSVLRRPRQPRPARRLTRGRSELPVLPPQRSGTRLPLAVGAVAPRARAGALEAAGSRRAALSLVGLTPPAATRPAHPR